MNDSNRKVEDLLENGIHSYRDSLDYIMGLMVEYQLPLSPIHGFAMIGSEHSSLPHRISNRIFERFGVKMVAKMVAALSLAYENIREGGYHPESFTALFGSRLFAKITTSLYGTNETHMKRVAATNITIPSSALIPYDEDTDLDSMVQEITAKDAQQSVQTLAMCGVPGFTLDGRGFIVLDASAVPEPMDNFVAFLAENVDLMGGRETYLEIGSGEDKDALIDAEIESIMMEDKGETPSLFDDIDPDSDENDDEVVRW